MAKTVKQYQLILPPHVESKTFSVGGGASVTIKNGTILDEDHMIVKKFKSYVTYIGEKLADAEVLNEDPVESAVVEADPVVETPVDPVVETKEVETPVEPVVEEKPTKGKPGPKAKA